MDFPPNIKKILQETAPQRKSCCADINNLGNYPGKDGEIKPGVPTCKICGARHYGLIINA